MPTNKTLSKKSAKSPTPKKLNSRSTFSLSKPAIFAIAFAVIGIIVLITSFAAPQEAKLERFKNNHEKGWIWDGIRETSADDSPCRSKDKDKAKDLLELIDPKTNKVSGCTHGPDPAPEGVDVRKRVEPVRTGEDDVTALAPGGGSGGASTGPATVSASPITCDGDGVSGNRVQVIYARASDMPDGYAKYKASIQAWASSANNIFVESGLQTGSARNIRFVHDANCYVDVKNVVLSSTGDDNMSNTRSELQMLGYDSSDRKYVVWMDANVYCGIADFRADGQPGANNINNYGRMWARIDNGCWNPTIYESPGYAYAAHEMMHLMGGVQGDSPHRSYQSHCTDEYDLMCYNDDVDVPLTYPRLVMTYTCPSAQLNLFDCNDDDYYHTGTPPVGSYLETHWNTANNIFMFAGSGSSQPPTSGDNLAPAVTISSPLDGAKIGNKTSIKASATDNVGVTRYEIWIDGVRKATTNSYSWNSAKASPGTHTITVKAFDAANNMGQKSITVTK
ncbi:MAG TPA: Ig-like domain-containing protein [Candidatus Limnocylindrales bacterium]|nr:Ig-like domain-containing protein [Candidatus Limnocylindrales bacterium]